MHLQEHEKNYKIITPYDAQRVLVEDTMKATDGLQWEEKVKFLLHSIFEAHAFQVYNVDSFQGFFCLFSSIFHH
jgi:superfamily I DNA and/or RNA helicase